jgi:hypothetical protein
LPCLLGIAESWAQRKQERGRGQTDEREDLKGAHLAGIGGNAGRPGAAAPRAIDVGRPPAPCFAIVVFRIPAQIRTPAPHACCVTARVRRYRLYRPSFFPSNEAFPSSLRTPPNPSQECHARLLTNFGYSYGP